MRVPPAGRAPPRTSSRQPRLSSRPPLSHCTEVEFLDDVCAYLSERKARRSRNLSRAASDLIVGFARFGSFDPGAVLRAVCAQQQSSVVLNTRDCLAVPHRGFLPRVQGKRLNRDTFPDAILNGAKLDLFALYKEVVSRGGILSAAYDRGRFTYVQTGFDEDGEGRCSPGPCLLRRTDPIAWP